MKMVDYIVRFSRRSRSNHAYKVHEDCCELDVLTHIGCRPAESRSLTFTESASLTRRTGKYLNNKIERRNANQFRAAVKAKRWIFHAKLRRTFFLFLNYVYILAQFWMISGRGRVLTCWLLPIISLCVTRIKRNFRCYNVCRNIHICVWKIQTLT